MEVKRSDPERFALAWDKPERCFCKELRPTVWQVHAAEVTFSSKSGENSNQNFNFCFICQLRCFHGSPKQKICALQRYAGLVLSLVLVSKVVIETQAGFNKGPKTLKGLAAEWRWQLSWAPLQDPHLKSICPPQLSAWAHCLNTYTSHSVCGPKKEIVLSTLSACKHKQTLHSLLLKYMSWWVTAWIQPLQAIISLCSLRLTLVYTCKSFPPWQTPNVTKRSSEFSRDQSSQPAMPEDKVNLINDFWNPRASQNPLNHLPPPSHTQTISWSNSMHLTSRRLIYLSKSLLG